MSERERIGFVVWRGHFTRGSGSEVPAWSAYAAGYLHPDYHQVCLVVTGDIVEADRLLSAAQVVEKGVGDAEVEAAARALYVRDGHGTGREFDALNDARLYGFYLDEARVALEAARGVES